LKEEESLTIKHKEYEETIHADGSVVDKRLHPGTATATRL
jgi:hypothetical protein